MNNNRCTGESGKTVGGHGPEKNTKNAGQHERRIFYHHGPLRPISKSLTKLDVAGKTQEEKIREK